MACQIFNRTVVLEYLLISTFKFVSSVLLSSLELLLNIFGLICKDRFLYDREENTVSPQKSNALLTTWTSMNCLSRLEGGRLVPPFSYVINMKEKSEHEIVIYIVFNLFDSMPASMHCCSCFIIKICCIFIQ